jgi:hypothetical protein
MTSEMTEDHLFAMLGEVEGPPSRLFLGTAAVDSVTADLSSVSAWKSQSVLGMEVVG